MLTFLYNLIIYPLESLVEFFYVVFFKGLNNSGLAIIGVSLMINILALPIYSKADKLQARERDKKAQLKPGVDRIKKYFKGDEQYMLLSTYYRQNQYHPAYALRSSLGILFQIPFFIAAYHFLDNLQALKGVPFWFINDLGKPDGLISIGAWKLNLLPFVMTAINIVSGAVYTRGFPLSEKIQLYGLAGLFLLLLYNSPAGLVYYWILNNLFSLGKNCFYRLKQPLKVFYAIIVAMTVSASVYLLFVKHLSISMGKKAAIVAGCLLICAIPFIVRFINSVYSRFLVGFANDNKRRNTVFLLSVFALWALSGFLVPSNLISSSVIEFSCKGAVDNPLVFLGKTSIFLLGACVFWPVSMYALFGKKTKTVLTLLFSATVFISIFDVFVFKGNYGMVSSYLQFADGAKMDPSLIETIASLLTAIACFVLCFFFLKQNKTGALSAILGLLGVSTVIAGTLNAAQISRDYETYRRNLLADTSKNAQSHSTTIKPVFHLSRTGKNVIVIFLDRAMNSYFPVILEQFPELRDDYKGFVYYPNTVSFGDHTRAGSPAMMGGYEYTPESMNEQPGKKLVDKHNESMLVLPRLFMNAGYQVTVTDPPFSNYAWTGDYSPFSPYPKIHASSVIGSLTLPYLLEHTADFQGVKDADETIQKYMPLFCLFKVFLPDIRPIFYDDGRYFTVDVFSNRADQFLNSYSELYYLDKIVDYSAVGNTYMFMDNDTTHEPLLLQAPDYIPRSKVTDIATPFPSSANITKSDIEIYHVNAAAFKAVGQWLSKLQHDGMYDNSRIIIVADHGAEAYSPVFSGFTGNNRIYAKYNPILMYKDFDSKDELRTDSSFMTNAEVPALATHNLGFDDKNPFTGISLSKRGKAVYHIGEWYEGADPMRSTLFESGSSEDFLVQSPIFRQENWVSAKK